MTGSVFTGDRARLLLLTGVGTRAAILAAAEEYGEWSGCPSSMLEIEESIEVSWNPLRLGPFNHGGFPG